MIQLFTHLEAARFVPVPSLISPVSPFQMTIRSISVSTRRHYRPENCGETRVKRGEVLVKCRGNAGTVALGRPGRNGERADSC